MKDRFSYFVKVKNFNTGKLEDYDIMPTIYSNIYNSKGKISKDFVVYGHDFERISVNSKELLGDFIRNLLMYHYWSKCEYEFVVIDWPYRNTIEESRPVKIDVYEQVKPNIDIIVRILWQELESKINK